MFRSEYADVLILDVPIHETLLGCAVGAVTFTDAVPRAVSGKVPCRRLKKRP